MERGGGKGREYGLPDTRSAMNPAKSYRARIVLPLSAPPVENGVVRVSGSRIAEVGPWTGGEPVEDLGDVILMPGLINAHCHLDYTVMRGAILPPSSFSNWVRRINDLKRILTEDDYLKSIADGFSELRRWGTTSVLNIESFPELMLRMPPPPLRTWWFYEMLDIRSRIHTQEVVAGALSFFERRPPGWAGGFGLSPHAPYTASDRLYDLAKAACEKYSMPWTSHVAETDEEFDMFVAGRGRMHDFLKSIGRDMTDCGAVTPLGRLVAAGAIPDGGILVHMNCLAESDYELLARHSRDWSIVHCPNCHAYFDRPRFELERLRALGFPISLGTDSLASNRTLNLFDEMQTLARACPGLRPAEILDMVTLNPARAIGRAGKLGEITPGAAADLIAIPYDGPAEGAVDAVVANRSRVDWMLVNGAPAAA
jgi:aminodeoxyfutalosine deaminase